MICENDKVAGETLSGVSTLNVIGRISGLLFAADEAITTVPEYVPEGSPEGLTPTAILAGVFALIGPAVSQFAPLLTVVVMTTGAELVTRIL